MHRIIRTKAYEAEHGPHFNEEHARKAVSKMENEDGSRGQHWSIEETTALANQHGIRLDDKFNKYDWYVALNMVYSDYYIVSVSKVYDEPLPPQQFPMPNQNRKKLVDIVISCGGEQKKLTVEEGKSLINDTQLGLTVATDKQHIVNMVKSSYNEYKAKKEAVARYDEEMTKCEAILKQLDYTEKEPEKEDPRIQELQDQVRELKDLIKQASNMVPPQMKQMLPQNMQKAMNEAS